MTAEIIHSVLLTTQDDLFLNLMKAHKASPQIPKSKNEKNYNFFVIFLMKLVFYKEIYFYGQKQGT